MAPCGEGGIAVFIGGLQVFQGVVQRILQIGCLIQFPGCGFDLEAVVVPENGVGLRIGEGIPLNGVGVLDAPGDPVLKIRPGLEDKFLYSHTSSSFPPFHVTASSETPQQHL